MKISLSSEQIMLRDAVTRAMAAGRDTLRIRAAEEAGIDKASWDRFRELDLLSLRVSEANGGAGLGILDGLIVCEAAAEMLALIPVADIFATSRLLDMIASSEAIACLKRIAAGDVAVLALHDSCERPRQYLVYGGVADIIIYRHGDDLRAHYPAKAAQPSLIGASSSMFVFEPENDVIVASGSEAVRAWGESCEEWKLYNAATIASLARQSLIEASAYANEREAFGRKIGSFQGLSHPLADSYADVEGARLLVWRTVERLALEAPNAGAMISQASWWAAERCGIAARRSMRVFGGYGMTMEYDAQIFFRRIAALSVAAGDPMLELDRAGRRLFLGEESPLPGPGPVPISFEFDDAALRVVELTREVFRDYVTPERAEWSFGSGDGHDPELFAALAARRVLYPDWPEEYGGLGGDTEAYTAAESVFNEFDWNFTIITVTSLFGKILMGFGSPEAREEILPRFAKGEAVGALCYSEPSAGSDIFAAKTRATRDGDDWIIDGQKIFTSQGHVADYGLLLARTGTGAKHHSLTLFAVPLTGAGYRCEPIRTIGGERTNTTFYDGMRISDRYRIGEVNGGTSVLSTALVLEQCASELYVGKLQQLLDNALDWVSEQDEIRLDAPENGDVLRRLARVATYREVTDVLSRRAVAESKAGKSEKHFGPLGKLFGSEAWVESGKMVLEISSPWTLMQGNSAIGKIEKSFRQSIPGTIYAGTSEIQRSLIAESGLRLPRSRA